MTITTNCTDRKVMVRQLAAHLGAEATYLGMPSGHYRVGDMIIDRNAAITGSAEDLMRAVPFLMENGYIDSIPETDSEAATDADPVVAVGEDDDFEAEDDHQPHVDQMCISLSLRELTPIAFINVLKLLYARQSLINAMTQSDTLYIDEELIDLLHDEKPDTVARICELLQAEADADMVRGIEIDGNRFLMMFPHSEADPTRWVHHGNLMTAIVDRAKAAHHISSKWVNPQPEEMKYFCRNWLIQLGLGGPTHKETQRVLLSHLQGYAAFRSTEKMNAHKAKYAALRQERREENNHEAD